MIEQFPSGVPAAEAPKKEKGFFDTKEKRDRIREKIRELIEKVNGDDYRLLVFLDRSARPISWMMREAWERYAPDGIEMPKIKFVNIGREKKALYGNIGGNVVPPDDFDFTSVDEWVHAVEEYWSGLESEEYVQKVRRDIKDGFGNKSFQGRSSKGKILLVDDFQNTGFSMDLAQKFFEHHFPDIKTETYTVLDEWDSRVFNGPWANMHMPWTDDKGYTMLAEADDRESVVAKAERDPRRRRKAEKLREEIKGIFSEDDGM